MSTRVVHPINGEKYLSHDCSTIQDMRAQIERMAPAMEEPSPEEEILEVENLDEYMASMGYIRMK